MLTRELAKIPCKKLPKMAYSYIDLRKNMEEDEETCLDFTKVNECLSEKLE